MACGYSKLEARDSDHNAKIRFQFRASYPEKIPNMWPNSVIRLRKPFLAFSQARMGEI